FFALHTSNGGKTWDQFRTPSRATHSTQFLDPANGWTAAFAPREGGAEAVVYDTTLMRTDNGGKSWRNDFIARGRRIRGVFFLSPTKGWAVGDRGMILCYEEKSKAN
ncbi:MAG: WD40/YVTN/BNR-like repeat-containing protein, partial [Blastocatellia bacterium]